MVYLQNEEYCWKHQKESNSVVISSDKFLLIKNHSFYVDNFKTQFFSCWLLRTIVGAKQYVELLWSISPDFLSKCVSILCSKKRWWRFYFTSKPSARKHILCASINFLHSGSSSPLKTTHSSLGFLVSGQQQQIALPDLSPTFCPTFFGGASVVVSYMSKREGEKKCSRMRTELIFIILICRSSTVCNSRTGWDEAAWPMVLIKSKVKVW